MDLVDVVARAMGPAGIYIMLGLGYNVIFSSSKVFNLAQGELSMLSMFIGTVLATSLGVPVVLALFIAMPAMAAMSMLEERVAIRPVVGEFDANRESITWALTTLAFAWILQSSAEAIWGSEPRAFPAMIPSSRWFVGNAIFNAQAVLLFGLAITLALTLHLFNTRFLLGKTLVAMAQDSESASLRGINTRRLKAMSFALAGAIGALAGFLIAPLTAVYPAIGGIYTFKGFVAIAIGGMGNHAGAVLGGVLLAVVEVVGADLVGAGYRDTVAMTALVVVLLTRPQGLLVTRHVRTV